MATTTLEVKRAIRNKFAWPGGYELYLVTSDGGVLCTDCGRREWSNIVYSMHHRLGNGWQVESVADTVDDEELVTCDHCGRAIFHPED